MSRCGGRDWAALPGPALFCILKSMARGSRLADIRAFARVCRAWRSSAFSDGRTGRRVLSVAPCLPPLILSYAGVSRIQEDDHFLRLLSLPHDEYYGMKAKHLPPVLLGVDVEIVGCSCGYVVVTCPEMSRGNEHYRRLFLVDPFADRADGVAHIELPRARSLVYQALLTAPPPTSSDGEGDCVVVVLSSKCIQYCRVGVGGEVVTAWGEIVMPFIHLHSVAIGGKVYILLQTWDILVLSGFSLPGPPSTTLVETTKGCLLHPTVPFMLHPLTVTELDGEMLILFQEEGKRMPRLFAGNTLAEVLGEELAAPRRGPYLAYRLDLSRREWVRIDSLGDYSVFLGSRTGHGMACRVAEWGGRKNCIYNVEPLRLVSVRNMQGAILEFHSKPELLNIFSNTFWVPPTTINRCV